MQKQSNQWIKAHLIRGGFYLLLALAGTLAFFFRVEARVNVSQRVLTFAERVAYQRTIEDVYWRHRIWPKENLNSKPSLDAVMLQAQLEKKVEDYLRSTQALHDYWQRPITAEDLQAEMDRMAQNTKQPEMLRELFDALGNDPFVIAECLARPVLSERLTTGFTQEERKGRLALSKIGGNNQTPKVAVANATYTLPVISDATTGCTPDSWAATSITNAPEPRYNHTAVWTGTEMIVWGGATEFPTAYLNSGGRYNPATDSWVATSITNAPDARESQTAVWTGSEMIVWGGIGSGAVYLNTGGRYNTVTDSWTATSTISAPQARTSHTAVWTGTQMIVWGGLGSRTLFRSGGRYNPDTDSWIPTSTTNAPAARDVHTAVWTGTEMIVWGGLVPPNTNVNTGGRYNPDTNSWIATSTTNAPTARDSHTAVWTGNEMIIWGGLSTISGGNSGGRYDPGTDDWIATSTTNAPKPRYGHTAVWTGSEMIVWGGDEFGRFYNGASYNPSTDSWIATSTRNAPSFRGGHTAVWTGSEMIIWGGSDMNFDLLDTGGRYCAPFGAPTPTPTPTATATPTPTVTPTATPGPIQLGANGKKVEGINTSRLKWRGATSANVDIYRDGNVIATTPNDGLYDDSTGTGGQASFMYQVCEAGTQTCSNTVTVNFGP